MKKLCDIAAKTLSLSDCEFIKDLGGKSGARVLACNVKSGDFSGQAILKFTDAAERGHPDEAAKHRDLFRIAPLFAREFVPALRDAKSVDGKSISMYEVAGVNVQSTSSLASLDAHEASQVLQKVAAVFVSGVGTQLLVANQTQNAEAVIRQWLGYRLDPNDGRIYNFIQTDAQVDPLAANFSWGTTTLPNPYAFAVRAAGRLPTHALRTTSGYAHGDLHAENVLVDRFFSQVGPKLKIIDFAEAQERCPLFFDHAHLELGELLRRCERVDIFRWLEFLGDLERIEELRDLRTPRVVSSNLGSAFEVAAAIRHSVRHELRKLGASFPQSDLPGQRLMAQLAAGLAYVNKKGMSREARFKALAYASKALQRFSEMYGLQWPIDSQRINFRDGPIIAATDAQAIWEACGLFDQHRYAHVLVVPETVRVTAWEANQIVRLPWLAVLDLNPASADQGMLAAIGSGEALARPINRRAPTDEPSTDFRRSLLWLLAAGDTRVGADTAVARREWQRTFRRLVEQHLGAFRRASSPKPVRVVIATNSERDEKVTGLWDVLDTEFGNALSTVLLTTSDSIASSFPADVTRLRLGISEFANAAHYILGEPLRTEDIQLPVRVTAEDGAIGRELKPFRLAELRSLSDTIEVVHQGLAFQPEDGTSDLHLFYRGGLISWRDLEDHLDVDRDVSATIEQEVTGKALETYRVSRYQIEHVAGAGGTTVARRVAWTLKARFPVVVVHRTSDKIELARSIHKVFEITGLPVVAVIEMSRARANESDIDELVGELKSSHSRAALITVKRVSTPRQGPLVFPLGRPMGRAEQTRFRRRYESLCSGPALNRLGHLAEEPRMEAYRLPFFYGLFAFDARFQGVPDYVAHHLEGISESARRAFIVMAIVGAYSQSSVPIDVLRGMLGIAIVDTLDPENALGREAQRLILFEDDGVRVVHPVIAEEILKNLLSEGSTEEWKHRLEDAVCDLINLVADVCGSDSDEGRDLLTNVLIRREPWPDEFGQERMRNFAELVMAIGSDAGQAKVLERLVERFPTEPHYWNHRGRFASMVEKNYPLAVECLDKAIALPQGESDHLHWHSLGMVHRYEVRRRLSALKRDATRSMASAVQAHAHVREIVEIAASCFEKARQFGSEDEYGFITDIQLIEETLRTLDILAGTTSALPLLKHEDIGQWCGAQLHRAESLLWSCRTLSAHRDESPERLIQLEGSIRALYGRFDDTIKHFEGSLKRSSIGRQDAAYTRRLLASMYFCRADRDWEHLGAEDRSRIFELMTQNLSYGKATQSDIRYWFHTFRRSPDFDVRNAISKLERLVSTDPSLEAFYYLYVNRFLEWFICRTTDVTAVKAAEAQCKDRAGKFQRSFPFEWVAIRPSACPIVQRSVLGSWRRDADVDFFEDTSRLRRVRGVISDLRGAPKAGKISFVPPCATASAGYQPLDAFFVPRGEFSPTSDLNVAVEFFLGISYEGLRAYSVVRATT